MPLHITLTITILVGSIVFCLFLAIGGHIMQHRRGALTPPPLFPVNRSINFFVYFYTAFFIIIFGMAAAHAYMMGGSSSYEGIRAMDLIRSSIEQTLLYLPCIIIYAFLPARENPRIPFRTKIIWGIVGLMIVTIPAQLMESFGFNHYLSELTGCPEQQNVVESMAKGTPEVKAVIACMAVLVAPITEECLFRGFIYNILKNKSGAISAAIASSILFSAVHTSLAQFIPLTLFALVQCYLYEKSRSLVLPIIFHMLFNGVSTLVILSL
jgi:membrane protease YdiL (CAAX protease family)